MAVIEQQKVDDLKAGIDQAFADIEAKLASVAFAEDLPIVGAQLQAAHQQGQAALRHVTAIKDAAFAALGTLNTLDEYDETQIETVLNNALSGFGTTVDAVVAGGDVSLNFSSDKTYGYVQGLAADLGLGALGITTDGTATATLQYAFDLTVGVDAGGFYVGTGAPTELEVNLSLAVDDAAFDATLGFINFSATDGGSTLTADFDVNLNDGDGKLRLGELGNDFLDATVRGAADIDIHLAGDMGSGAFPSMGMDLEVDWDFSAGTQVDPDDDNSGFGLVPTVAFNNVTYDLGSFFEDYVKPLVETIEKILEPIDIALAVLNSDIKALKILPNWQSVFDRTGAVDGDLDVPDGKITLLDFLKMGDPDIDLVPLIQTMQLVDEVIDWAAFLTGKTFAPESYNLGSFDLDGADIRAAAFVIEEAIPRITSAAANLEAVIAGLEGPGWTENGDTGGEMFLSLIGSPHFAFPIIENPLSAIGLLLGKTADLFELDLPEVEVGISGQQLASVSVFPGIDVKLEGGLSLALDLSMGFDSRGLGQFADSGFTDFAAILNGFYLNDFDGNGAERPEVTFEVSLDLIVALNAIVADLGGGGGIAGEIVFDLADSLWENETTEAGRIYYDYIASQITSNAFGLFDTSGRITAGLTAYARILGVEVWRGYSPRVTLGSFSFNGDPVVPGGSEPPPPVGLADEIGDTLHLNIGTRAGERDFGDTTDDAESFDIGLAGGLAVAAFGLQESFSGVTLIVGDGGEGNDEIIVAETVVTAASLAGGAGDDTLVGGAGGDTLGGGSGRDYLEGGDGIDTLDGGDENDVLVGGAGGDTLDGGGGIDIVSYMLSGAAVAIDLNAATQSGGDAEGDILIDVEVVEGSGFADTMTGAGTNDTFVGLGGDDGLAGGTGNDVLVGNAGNDTLDGGTGQDILIGGLGDDTYHVDDPGDVVSENYLNEIVGDGGHDTIVASIAYTLDHADRQDIEDLELTGPARSGTGNALANLVTGTAGDDFIYGLDGEDRLDGNAGDDQLYGGEQADELEGGADDDELDGGGGADTLTGGTGSDTYHVDDAGDVIVEIDGEGADTLVATVDYVLAAGVSVEMLTASAGAGGVDLTANEFDQVLIGSSGADTLEGKGGVDNHLGGGGTDTATYRSSSAGVTIDLELAAQQGGDAEGDTYVSIEIVEGSGNADHLHGTLTGSDHLRGIGGHDLLHGYGGADTLVGGAGDDLLDGGAGDDTMIGGSGNDTYYVDSLGDDVDEVADGGSGVDHVIADLDYSIAGNAGIENLTIVGDARIATGNGNANVVTGTGFDDTIDGLAGGDTMVGGDGDDTYWFDSHGDTAVELADEGHDRIFLSIATYVTPTFYPTPNPNPDPVAEFDMAVVAANVEDLTVADHDWRVDIWGNDLGNRIVANQRDNTVHGGGGDDTIVAGGGSDTIHGDEGDDTAVFSLSEPYADNWFDGGDGTDTLVLDWSAAVHGIRWYGGYYFTYFDGHGSVYFNHSGVERWQITGGAAGDDLRGGTLDDILVGGGGDDTLRGYAGKDTYHGGDGIDTVLDTTVASAEGEDFRLVLAENQLAEVVSNEGTDIETRWQGIEFVRVTTGAGDDLLDVRGTDAVGQHVFDAGDGDDTFRIDIGSRGDHDFQGGGGTDTLVLDWSGAVHGISWSGGYYTTYIDGHGGVYVDHSGVERWQITGGAAGDDLRGAALDDILIGGGGDDTLRGYAGKDTYHGGDGIDTVLDTTVASAEGEDFRLVLAENQLAEVVSNEGTDIETRWQGIEFVRVTTGAGDDLLDVRGTDAVGQHVFDAGDGDDTFRIDIGSRGDHDFQGGGGTDTLVLDWSGAINGIGWSGGYYTTYIDGHGGVYVDHSGVERWQITGGLAGDDLRGGALDDILIGGGGDDWLRGYAGKGTYHGGDGIDTVLDTTVASTEGEDFRLVLAENQLAEVVSNEGTDIETRWQGVEFVRVTTGAGDDLLDVRGTDAVGQHVFDAGDGDDTFRIDIGSRGDHDFQGGGGTDTLVLDWSGAVNGIGWPGGYYATYIDGFGTIYLSYSDVERWQITGGAAGDDLRGGALDDILDGGAGGNDGLTGGDGEDLFIYRSGHDTVHDFDLEDDRVGGGALDAVGTLAELRAFVDQTDHANAVFTFSDGNTLTLTGVDWEELTLANIHSDAPRIVSAGGAAATSVSVGENSRAVTAIEAIDRASVVYSIDGGGDAGLFEIDAATGALSFRTAPDFENPAGAGHDNQYVVVVRAANPSGFFDTQTVAVTVADVNEKPAITSNGAGAAASVAENATTVTTVATSDPDTGDTRTFTLSGADASKFAISSAGVLAFRSAPDFEAKADAGGNNVYDVTVTVKDGGNLTDSQALAITVADVNEAPSIGSNDGLTVAENSTAVTTMASADPDAGDTRAFTLSGADASKFSISPAGVLAFRSAPDFEAKADAGGNNVYDVTVTVKDRGSLTDSKALKVAVTDVNEAPAITSNGGGARAAISVGENSSAVATVTSTDPDTGDMRTFTLSGADASKFSISSAGVLAFRSAPDFEAKADAGGNNVYDVTVTVRDGGNLTDSQALAITVADVNEAPAITSGKGADRIALERAENRKPVTRLKAADVDKDALTYSIDGGADARLFEIDAASGALSFKSGPDFEAPRDKGKNNVYDVIVSAGDGALADTQAVSVTVTDVAGKAVTGRSRADRLKGTAEADKLDGAGGKDRIDGYAGNDRITGGAGADKLAGGAGRDRINGSAGNDRITGGAGADKLAGSGGRDRIDGSAGKDSIVGGAGADKLTGGAGRDTFVFEALGDSKRSAKKRDTIFDFDHKEKDRIDLSAIDARSASGKDDKFAFKGTAAFSGKAGELRYEKSGGDTFVYGDVDGDGKADFAIAIDVDIALKKADFIL